jgi:hypothetical protein
MELENLIGLHAKDLRLLDFLRRLGEEPQIFEMMEDDPSESGVLVFKKVGLQISFDKERKVNTIHVFSEGMQGYGQYSGALPMGLSFQMNRKATIALLGKPSRTGGPVKAILGKNVHYWDRWDSESFVLHLMYPEKKDSITELTIMSVDRVPK